MADDGFPMHSVTGSKGGGSQRTPIEAPDSLYSTAIARIVDILSEGEIVGLENGLKDVLLDETPVMNDDGSLNFESVQVELRTGTPDQEPIPGMPFVESEIGVGVELKQVTPWTRAVSNTQLSAIKLRLAVASLTKTDQATGDTNGYRVDYAIDLATDGGAFEEVFASAFAGKTTTTYERVHRIDLPPAASGWTVRVRRITPDEESQYVQDTTYVQAITEVIDAKLRYPYTALAGVSLDASQFRSIPRRAYRAKGRIIRVPTNYDPEARTYTGVWDGTFKLAWTTNPAWIWFDLVTNERYGLGRRVPEARIDKWSLYKIGMYCDELVPDGKGGMEPRFQCTVYIQKRAEAYKVLRDLASVFRGITYWAGGSVVAQADQPEDPVYTYTNSNIVDGRFVYNGTGRKARHTVAMVSWVNPDNFGKAEVEPVVDEEGIIRYGIQPINVTAFGCISQSQAQRVGRWILLTELAETDAIRFDVGLDGTLVAPGRIVRVVDADRAGRRVGGRISSAAASSIVVDKLPDVVPSAGDTLVTIAPNGVAQENVVQSVDVPTRTITVTTPFGATPVAQSVWAVESTELQAQLYRIIGITENTDAGTFGVAAVQHNPSKFDAVDLGTKLEERPTSLLPSTVVASPASVVLTSVERAGQVVASILLSADWPNVPGAAHYYIQWKRDDGEWSPPEKTQSSSADLSNAFPGTWRARVWCVGVNGISSKPTVSNPLVVVDQSLTPGFVDDLNAGIDNALGTAQNAQATADGKIVSFWQTSPPIIGPGVNEAHEGDIWFDTNDGNKVYRVVSGAWAVAADDDMAAALAAASDAQATADGKVKTYFQATAPTAEAVGDLWFNTTTSKLFRWNGSAWTQNIGDVTLAQLAGSGVNILPDQYSTYEATTLPAFTLPNGAGVTRDGGGVITRALQITGAAHVSVYFGSSIPGSGLKLSPGKRYIVSAWYASQQSGNTVKFFIETNGGVYYYSAPVAAVGANNYTRVSAVIDTSANTQTDAWLGVTKEQSEAVALDGIMVEEQVGTLSTPSAYSRGTPASIAINAIAAAAAAQDTADGKIVTFYQNTTPTGGTLGDLWFHTGEGNKVYRHNGTSWVESQDDAIAQAINNAAGAQATADGKVTTFYAATAPTATALGDLWFNTTTKVLSRWNGSAWVAVADSSEDAVNALILNGGFEQGSLHWTFEEGTYAEQSTNAARTGLWGAVIGPTSGGVQRTYTTRQYPVQVGQQIILSADIRNLGNGANGNCYIELLCYDAGGGFFAAPAYAQSNVHRTGNTEWKTVVNKFGVPPNTVAVRFGVVATGHTNGYWCADNVRAFLTDAEAHPAANGENLIPNGNFAANSIGATNAVYAAAGQVNRKVIDGWRIDTVLANAFSDAMTVGLEQGQVAAAPGNRNAFIGDNGATLPTGSTRVYIASDEYIPAAGGEVLTVESVMQVDAGSAIPSGVTIYTYVGLWCYDVDKGLLGFVGHSIPNLRGGWAPSGNVTLPSGTAFVRGIFGLDYNNSGAPVAMGWAVMHARWARIMVRRSVTLDQPNIRDGSTYGRTAMNDLFVSGGINRIGLRIPGSGHRIGNQANIVQSLATAYGSVRTTTALTATSTGAVSVNAHTVRYGGFSVSYSAVTNAVTGLSQGVTYAIYCFDDAFAGGARTWFAATSREAAMNQGDGVVIAGEITIPTSGSSSGGGGGGMDCVATDMLLPCGLAAHEVAADDFILCWDYDADNPGETYEQVEASYVAEQHCVRIETTSGAAVVASAETPMTLRDGTSVPIADMAGHLALVRDELGRLSWEQVVKAEYVGLHPVQRIRVHQRCYFAGERADRTIATHNPTQKP